MLEQAKRELEVLAKGEKKKRYLDLNLALLSRKTKKDEEIKEKMTKVRRGKCCRARAWKRYCSMSLLASWISRPSVSLCVCVSLVRKIMHCFCVTV